MKTTAAVLTVAIALVLLEPPALCQQQSLTIIQKDRAFFPAEITIKAGQTLQFENDDQFIHQIYVDSDLIDYDSKEQPPGETLSITFPIKGTFYVRCHIHPKMQLIVHVQ